MSVDDIRSQLTQYEKGGVKNTIQNCMFVLQNDIKLKRAIAFNLLTGRVDIIKPVGWERTSSVLNDTDIRYIKLYLETNYGLTSENKINDAISIVANENRYHPIRDKLNALVWDGTERIKDFLPHFLGADRSKYTFEVMKITLLGAIQRVMNPGCKFETMLCLVGGQGAGKSTFFRFLAINDEWFSDDLKRLDDENVFRKLQGHWIIEMSEMLATANAKSIEETKSFISKQKDTYKVPYETHPVDRPRQCIFGGTSNSLDFLPLDRTGNRRFLPVMIYPERAECHILDNEAESRKFIEQVWAEAMQIYKSGNYKLVLDKEMYKELTAIQQNFMPEDTKSGIIQAFLEKYTGDTVCSKQLFVEALKHSSYEEPKQWEIREINDIMNHSISGWTAFSNPRYFENYGRQKGWIRDKEQQKLHEEVPVQYSLLDEYETIS